MSLFSDVSSQFPPGKFTALRSWILRNRKGLAARLATIDAEIIRIGQITVLYQGVRSDDGDIRMTEKRKGFSVTPGSSLERLVQAYMAQGGNPFDISSFMHPDKIKLETDDGEYGEVVAIYETYPNDGMITPRTVDSSSPSEDPEDSGLGAYRGGWPDTARYYPARLGKRPSPGQGQTEPIVRLIGQVRQWANQDIKERLQDMEWRIIKQCDLKEQLEHERFVVLEQAFGGATTGLGVFDDDKHVRAYLVQNLLTDMGQLLWPSNLPGTGVELEGHPTMGKPRAEQCLDFSFDDDPSEVVLGS